ncbi:MAG: hypothetical protein V4596_10705 [Bdellovibrionota bacterium]
MSIKISSKSLGNAQASKKNLFSKLQSLTFSNFVPSTFASSRLEEREGHLDLESQEILSLLKGNIEKLADASSRVEFMMGEISHLMKKGI